MLKRISWGIAIALSAVGTISFGTAAWAQTCANYPYTLANGTTADADQVNANFAAIQSCANTSLAPSASPTFTGTAHFKGAPSSAPIIFTDTSWPADTFAMTIGQYNGGTTVFQTINTTNWELESGITPTIFVNTSANVGIRTTSPSYTLHVNGSVAGTSAYNNLSDVRLKKNIVPIADALAIIGQLQGVRFDWRKPDERTVGKNLNLPVNDPQVGFIAQEVKKVLPQAVTVADSGDHLMSTQESKVVPVLVEAVKQLAAMNRAQAHQIQKLEQKVSVLEQKTRIRTAANDISAR
jgi:hypothetical protein